MNQARQAPDGRSWRAPAAVLAVALLLRLGAALLLPEVRFPDSATYEDLAASVRERGELADRGGNRAAVAPGYPVFLAGCRAALGGSALAYRLPQALLGALTVLGVWLLARMVWGRRAALAAGALAALDPFAGYFEMLGMSEGPALCLLVWTGAAAWTARSRVWAAPLAGSLCAGAALFRPGWMLTGLALVLLALAVPGPDRPRESRAWLRAALAAAALVLVMSPWWIRNHRALGAFVPLSTGGGQTLYEGNSPNATGGPAVPETAGERLRELEALDELERDRLLAAEARAWIRANPGRFARLAVVKFARTWSPVPNEPNHRRWHHLAASALDFAAVLFLAGAGLFLAVRGSRARALWCLAPAAAVVLGHLFVIGSVRYRLPAWPFLEVLAGAGAVALWGRILPGGRKPEGTGATPGAADGGPPADA